MDFYQNLKSICDSKSTTITALLKKLQLSSAYGTNWKTGTSPTLEVLIMLSKALNVSLDYLVFGKVAAPVSESERQLLDKFNSLSEQDKGRILERIDILAQNSECD